MTHYWRRHRSTRIPRWTRLITTVGLLLACVLAALPAMASASTPEVRGEWTIVLTYPGGTVNGTALVTTEADGQGKFAAQSVLLDGSIPGGFNGTLEGATATVETSSQQNGQFPPGKFNSSTMTVESTSNSLSMSGSGTFAIGGESFPATLVATRVKTQKQIEEQEQREKQEQEERADRARVRGEWSLTIESGPQSVKGTAVISTEATAKNEFTSAGGLFESAIPGVFSGTLEVTEASVTIVTQAAGPYPEGKFTGTKLTLASTANSMSITGSGTLTLGANSGPATLTATRIKNHEEVVTREKKEREAKEAQEKAEAEAREAKEKEAAEKIAAEAKEKEAAEKVAREAKEKQELEARKAAEKAPPPPPPAPTPAALVSVKLTGNSFTAGASGQVSLVIGNPNDYAISGRVTLVAQVAGAAKSPGKKTIALGTASFGVSSSGKQVVKLELSQKGRSELTHRKTLRVLATFTTKAGGQTTITKTFSLTLHAASTHRKG
jgi:FKBP-type peptidyl-prolyl cis-trans isomerase